VVNVVTEDIAEKMNICATDFPPEMSEIEIARFTTAPWQVVKQPHRRSNARGTSAAM
jgi:flavin reductase (DIM6/NTAB) family NADH-FMN oxidoreductase RutF